MIEQEAQVNHFDRTLTWRIPHLASSEQKRIRFRLKVHSEGEVDFPVTVSQDGRESQTISQATQVR